MMDKIQKVLFGRENQPIQFDSLKITCYHLNDGTRIFTKGSVARAMGYDGKSNDWLFDFISHIGRFFTVSPHFLEDLKKDIVYETSNEEIKNDGILPEMLLTACQTIIKAKNSGFLYLSELKFAKAAETIVTAFNNSPIEDQIDYATGYSLFKYNHIEALIRFYKSRVNASYPLWVRAFPHQFIEQILELTSTEWTGLNLNPEPIAKFIEDTVFGRIEADLLNILNTSKPRMKYRKKNTAEEYLLNKDLEDHIAIITELLKTTQSPETLVRFLETEFPGRKGEIVWQKEADYESERLDIFRKKIEKAVLPKQRPRT